jgi:uncharacterized protein (TIRG00374 family)
MSDLGGDRQHQQNSYRGARRDDREVSKPVPRWHKVLSAAGCLALLVLMFVGVIPQFTSYSDTWAHMAGLGALWWVAIAVSAIVNQVSIVWPYQAALPGLQFRLGFLETATTSAISSTVPAGGAVAIGMTYKMFSSFGFADLDISTAVVVTGIWNLAAKLSLPIAAVALLAATAHPPQGALAAAILGVVVLMVAGVALWLVFRSETSARWLGHRADRLVNRILHFFHKAEVDRIERAVLHFRRQTVETAHRRGWLLTWAVLANQLAVLLLVLIIVRAVGVPATQVSFAAVLTSFAVARLVGAVPIAPGGLGTVDAAFVAMLTAFGTNASHALAADFLWRLTTYVPPLVLGVVTYLIWIRREEHRTTAMPTATP